MGYERKDIQILGGGFNLLPPGDKVPQTDYLLAQNWRVDREGRLVSRYGYPRKFQIAGPAITHSAAVFGGVEGDYYVGGNNSAGQGFVYFNFAAGPIASGFDGNRIAMVPMLGWMWIMNAGGAGKHNAASGYHQWGIDAPTNACTAAAGAANDSGPNGSYQFYVTFVTADGSVESNGGPVSNSVTVDHANLALSGIPTSSDAQVGQRNIYATGGTLGQAYQVGTINDNVTTAFTVTVSDNTATNDGVVLPTDHDGPPLGSGMVGPFFQRLMAWKGNRLFWTDPNLPQYFPGAADDQVGNWDDVGMDGEDIVWCTIHKNVLVIYKERTIWRLVGDPDTGYIECMHEGCGLVSAFAVAGAGDVDYFVGPKGLYRNTIDRIEDVTGPLRPLFDESYTNAGSLTRPGSIAPGPNYYSNSLHCYGVALGYAMGRLYVAFAETTTATGAPPVLIYHEASGKWMYDRNALGVQPFQGFVFDGVQMVGLTGNNLNSGLGYNLDDFSARYPQDDGATPIEAVYQSHFEDVRLPDTDKVWCEIAIDVELNGDAAAVYVATNTGALTQIGSIPGAGRQTVNFTLGGGDGLTARNLSVAIKATLNAPAALHNVFLYYYTEARLGSAVVTLPTDLNLARVKQCKELMLDIDAGAGAVTAKIASDLPGNAIALRQTVAVAQAGRAIRKYPFSTIEGFLWRLALTGGPFRLYSARLLMRPIGVYVEAYEAAAGFVWDSMEQSFDDGITHIQRQALIAIAALPIKRARELSIEIDTFGGDVTVSWLSDLPGDAMASRYTKTINTGTAGRRYVRLTMAAGNVAPIEGRMFRLQLSGSAKFILYGAAVELLAVGVYLEASEAAGGAVYDSREIDGGTPGVKEARELELDIETTGNVTAQLLGDLAAPVTKTVSTTGRQKVMIPLTVSAATDSFCEGRLFRLLLSGANAVRLYGARIQVRPFGLYLTAEETGGGALWDSTALDLGSAAVKQLREIELDLQSTAASTVTVYSDLPGNAMAARATKTVAIAAARTKVRIPLPQGSVPDAYLYGRLVRVTVATTGTLKLFGARLQARPVGTYIEASEAAGGAVWDSSATDLGSPMVKTFDEVRFEMDSDSSCALTVYTDLPGEGLANRGTFTLTPGASGRHWVTVPLAEGVEGRSIRLVVASTSGFRLYKAQVRAGHIGRYLAGVTASGGMDALRTLEFDFRTERVKLLKRVEVDLRADGAVPVVVYSDQTGAIAAAYSGSIAAGGRAVVSLPMPPGVRGRLLRISLAGGPARVYRVRVWTRPVNEPQAQWKWEDYPLEESDVVPAWTDLPVDPTPDQFTWAALPVPETPAELSWIPLPVNPTEPQWFWAKVLSVEETPDTWTWVDVPFSVQ